MGLITSIFFLLMYTAIQSALGQATDVYEDVGVVGGHKINIEDAPYMAGFLRRKNVVCAGSIIHEQFILTSAACAKTWYPIRHAHIGSNRARRGGSFPDIVDMMCHENYDLHTLDNNICLLKLGIPLIFGSGVAKVELPDENIVIAAGTMVNVTGWGNIEGIGNQYPKFLQQASVSIVSDDSCLRFAPNMTENMLCAGSQGRDSCRGDGGGPLTQNNVQLGIVNFGPPTCGQQPTIYVRVSKYINWIRKTIQKNL